MLNIAEILSDNLSDTDDEEQNVLNLRKRRKRPRVVLDFQNESDQKVENTEVAIDDTVWPR